MLDSLMCDYLRAPQDRCSSFDSLMLSRRREYCNTAINTYNAEYMAHSTNLGEFEQIVLLAILRLGDDAYGAEIRREISVRTGRETAPGALYTTLDRLEDKGLIRSRMGAPTPERGGRAKRFFKVCAPGLRAIVRAQQAYRELLKGLELPGGLHV